MLKKGFILLTICTVFWLGGCGNSAQEQTTEVTTAAETEVTTAADITAADTTTQEATDQVSEETAQAESQKEEVYQVAGWTFTYEGSEVNDSLENAGEVLGYGSVETESFSKEAGDEQKFCLIKLKIAKEDSTEVIQWDQMKLVDSQGKEYTRADDEFISDLGMKRLPGTDLNFGENEGWICFEVDKDAEGLTLEYPFESEKLAIEIK